MPDNISSMSAAPPKKDAAYWNNLARLAIDSEEALTELYNRFFSPVYKFLLSQVRNSDATDDLASNVFMKMYQNLERFDENKASFFHMAKSYRRQRSAYVFPHTGTARR